MRASSFAACLCAMLALTACNAPTYLKHGRDTVSPFTVCGERVDAGWMYGNATSPGTRFYTVTHGEAQRELVGRTCEDGETHDCTKFVLFVLDAGAYGPEECSRSVVSFSVSEDGGDRVKATAWCPSGLVRMRADFTGKCEPIYIHRTR